MKQPDPSEQSLHQQCTHKTSADIQQEPGTHSQGCRTTNRAYWSGQGRLEWRGYSVTALSDFNNTPNYLLFRFDKKCSYTIWFYICFKVTLQRHDRFLLQFLNALLREFCLVPSAWNRVSFGLSSLLLSSLYLPDLPESLLGLNIYVNLLQWEKQHHCTEKLGNTEFYAQYYNQFDKQKKQTFQHTYSGVSFFLFCLYLMAAYCKAEYKLLAVTHATLEVLLGNQWEVPEQLSSTHTHRSLQVPIILHMPCTFQQVCGVGHSCFVTGRAMQLCKQHSRQNQDGEKTQSCQRPSVSLRVGHAPQDSLFGIGVSSFVQRADFSLHKAPQTTLETLTQASSSTKQHKPAASSKLSRICTT